eukprot:365548-Chlamydomonas_euryale.AAC.1
MTCSVAWCGRDCGTSSIPHVTHCRFKHAETLEGLPVSRLALKRCHAPPMQPARCGRDCGTSSIPARAETPCGTRDGMKRPNFTWGLFTIAKTE